VLDAETKKPIANVFVITKGSTRNGVTNYLGFFQLEIAPGDSVLTSSHIGYHASELSIPMEDKFVFSLTPKVTVLTTLDLSGFTADSKYEIKEESLRTPAPGTELPARFKGGEEGIYNYLGDNLKLSADNRVDGSVTISFIVAKNGRTREITMDGDTLAGIGAQLFSLIENMPEWAPASQNGVAVDQRFKLIVKYSNQIFLVVEETATFPGGLDEFYKFVLKNLRYPVYERTNKIEGKVFVEFVITKTGKIDIESVKAIKGVSRGLDEEAVRLIKDSPDWIPGSQRGSLVAQKMVLPVAFKLLR
jgi:TonB family protein